ncbi:MAG TPA: Xaa-Pro peptidase family protein [Candidatus Dormibacteraeota bacterium]|nr:Xaa-Pro peptidase family protein [Candidatus Dormibacteraeota bacterium]
MPFLPRSVYDYRRRRMDALMDAERLDALAFVSDEFVQFATNFHVDVRTWERPILVVVPRNGAPFGVMHELSTNHLRFHRDRGALWLDEVQLYSEHPRVGSRLPLLPQWPALAADLLHAHGLSRGRVGVENAGGLLARVSAVLPELRLVNALAGMRALRWVKCPEELQLHRTAASLTDFGQACYREHIRPGRLVQELDYAVSGMIAEEAARRLPDEHLEPRCMTLTGPDAASPHGNGATTGSRFQEGHVVVVICNVRLNGMLTENERTYFVGRPSDQQRELYETARAANEAARDAAVVGNPVFAIDAAAQAVIERRGHGDYVLHRTGHGMGTQGHEYPEDMAFNSRPLQAGEVYSIEPGLYVWGLGGFRLDDTVVVGTPPEVLTAAPRDIDSAALGAAPV